LLARAKKDKLGEAVVERPKRASEVLDDALDAVLVKDRQVKSRTKASQTKARARVTATASSTGAKAHPVRAAKSAARGASKTSAKAAGKSSKSRSKR
jgi:hypothetical protein